MFRKWETMQYFLNIFYKKGGLFQGLLSDVELLKKLFTKKANKDANITFNIIAILSYV